MLHLQPDFFQSIQFISISSLPSVFLSLLCCLFLFPSNLGNHQSSQSFIFVMASYEQQQGKPLPKFGEWDVNDPASAEGFTVIFNKARDEKKTGRGGSGRVASQRRSDSRKDDDKPPKKKWFCFAA